MKKLKTDIIILAVLLILAWMIVTVYIGNTGLDVQLHDTYFVIDRISLMIMTAGPLTFLIFLARALATKFRAIGPNVGLIIGLIFVALTTYGIIQLQQSYLTLMTRPDDEGLPDLGQFTADFKRRINWSWALFSFWILALALLILQTIRIWKARRASA